MKTIAIMQPYLFPYIGYFQLIKHVDTFVLYDDVQFVNRGWINRNRILSNKKECNIVFPLKKASSRDKINTRVFADNIDHFKKKQTAIIRQSYQKAPFYNEAIEIIESVLNFLTGDLVLAIYKHFENILEYISINNNLILSSEFSLPSNFTGQKRIIEICKCLNATDYVNSIGGIELYSPKIFNENNLTLHFLKPRLEPYEQFGGEFVPGLSIIDVMMFNSPDKIQSMLDDYELITPKD